MNNATYNIIQMLRNRRKREGWNPPPEPEPMNDEEMEAHYDSWAGIDDDETED